MSALLARQRHSNKLELRDVPAAAQHGLGHQQCPDTRQMDEWREAAAPAAVGGARTAMRRTARRRSEVVARARGGRDYQWRCACTAAVESVSSRAAVSEGHKRRMADTRSGQGQPARCADTQLARTHTLPCSVCCKRRHCNSLLVLLHYCASLCRCSIRPVCCVRTGRRDADAELNAASESRKRKRNSSGGGAMDAGGRADD